MGLGSKEAEIARETHEKMQKKAKVQIRNAKEVFWDIVYVDQHDTPIVQRRKAGNQRPRSESIPRALE